MHLQDFVSRILGVVFLSYIGPFAIAQSDDRKNIGFGHEAWNNVWATGVYQIKYFPPDKVVRPGHIHLPNYQPLILLQSSPPKSNYGAVPKGTENTSTHDKGKDLEKAQDAEGSFNLREYLASSADRNQQAGIKHKHVGVTWEGLQVDVIGDANYKVSSELTDLFGSA